MVAPTLGFSIAGGGRKPCCAKPSNGFLKHSASRFLNKWFCDRIDAPLKGEIRMNVPQPVSIHGGHSGQFCGHAKDTLEEIVLAYIDQQYPWVGITEHMPPVSDDFVYPEEKHAGLDANALKERFAGYMTTCRHLQSKYADDIRI